MVKNCVFNSKSNILCHTLKKVSVTPSVTLCEFGLKSKDFVTLAKTKFDSICDSRKIIYIFFTNT